MTARDARSRFGEFPDVARRKPVVATKNDRPVAGTISIANAADTLIPKMFSEMGPGYEEWLSVLRRDGFDEGIRVVALAEQHYANVVSCGKAGADSLKFAISSACFALAAATDRSLTGP